MTSPEYLKRTEMEPIILNSYNLASAESAIVRRCFEDNPSVSNEQRATMLGISERTLYRLADRYGFGREYTQFLRAKKLLEKCGYSVIKKED